VYRYMNLHLLVEVAVVALAALVTIASGFFLGVFYPEDGSDIFLRNVDCKVSLRVCHRHAGFLSWYILS
jgi:hypothetical protein